MCRNDILGPDKSSYVNFWLDRAENWPAVHADLAEIGIAYQPYKSGARIVETATHRQPPRRERIGAFISAIVPLAAPTNGICACGSACKKDPFSGVIGVQMGPLISMV